MSGSWGGVGGEQGGGMGGGPARLEAPGLLGSGSRAGWQEASFACCWVVFVTNGAEGTGWWGGGRGHLGPRLALG